MALAPLTLDDLTWSDMVGAIRGRIISASSAKWTLHAPVDPGVTLLELFAWLLEQRVYFIDQVPPSLQRGLLRLLGNAPLPERSASTVLAFDRPDPNDPDFKSYLAVPAGSLMKQRRRGAPLYFTTDADFTRVPVGRIGLVVGGADRSLDLMHGRILFLLPAAAPFSSQIIVWLAAPPTVAGTLSLLLELTPPAAIPPQWAVGAPDGVPPPATVSFAYAATGGADLPFATADDGTGGLRRSGLLRLALPLDWKPESTTPDSDGNLPYAVKIAVAQPTYSTPPRVAAITANVAIARHTRPAQLLPAQPLSWAPVAGRPSIALAAADQPPIVASVKLRLRERNDGAWHDWQPVDDLSFSGPGDRVFLVDRGMGVLTFGDGLTGRMPVLDPAHPNVEVDYAVGAGPDGNVGSGASWDGAGGLVAVNPVAAEGGADPESLDDAQQRVRLDQQKPTRAITADDFRALVVNSRILDEDSPWGVSIARAHAALGFLADFPCTIVPGAVTLFIVPDVPFDEPSDMAEAIDVAAPQPDPGTLALARKRIEAARLVASEVVVSGPIYTPVVIVADVAADPRDPAALRQTVSDRIRTYFHPLRGGDDGLGWPFGAPVRPSALLEQIEVALGDDGDVTGAAIGVGGATPAPSCADVPIGAHRLINLVQVTVRLSPRPAPPGGLR